MYVCVDKVCCTSMRYGFVKGTERGCLVRKERAVHQLGPGNPIARIPNILAIGDGLACRSQVI